MKVNIFDRAFNQLGYTRKSLNHTPYDRLNNFLKRLVPVEVPLIRIGDNADGGYLFPREFPLPTTLFSPGVNDQDSFEQYFANKGVKCFLADYSVDSNPHPHENIYFIKKFIGKGGENFLSLEDWINQSVGFEQKGLCLQMDIEGWEYQNIINTSIETFERFDSLCIEFHAFNHMGYAHSFSLMEEVFNKLLQTFVPVHVHANNCCGFDLIHGFVLPIAVEMTLIHRNSSILTREVTRVNKMEHPLDQMNHLDKPKIVLESWLKP
jgi:hypothetical protein